MLVFTAAAHQFFSASRAVCVGCCHAFQCFVDGQLGLVHPVVRTVSRSSLGNASQKLSAGRAVNLRVVAVTRVERVCGCITQRTQAPDGRDAGVMYLRGSDSIRRGIGTDSRLGSRRRVRAVMRHPPCNSWPNSISLQRRMCIQPRLLRCLP